MKPQLNHTIVHARDKVESAQFLADVMGFDPPTDFAIFRVVEAGNGVSLDFIDVGDSPLNTNHYAFLVTEADFDEIFGRVVERGLEYWADPGLSRRAEINDYDGGRGVYFTDPNGHLLEIITRPYGSGPLG